MGPRSSQKGLTPTRHSRSTPPEVPHPPSLVPPSTRWGCQKSARSGPLARRVDGKLSRKMSLSPALPPALGSHSVTAPTALLQSTVLGV